MTLSTPPSKNLKRICLILLYFSKTVPPYWNGFIDSCADNKNIDFLIISDCTLSDLPSNVRHISMSWHFLQNIVTEKFKKVGIDKVCMTFPYKLCDYKPTYGYLFQEYLIGYDYWGYIDCDLVFGNLEKFLNEIGFENYDRIYRAGHLSIYRNTSELNTLFATEFEGFDSFKKIAASTFIYNYDELGINQILIHNNFKFFNKGQDATMAIYDFTFRWCNSGKPELGDLFVKENDGSTVVYSESPNGEIHKQEVNYIHYMTKKIVSIPKGMKRPFCISHKGVFYIGDMDIRQAINLYTKCTSEDQIRFIKQEKRRFRKETVKKVCREFKYNGLYTITILYNRFGSWLKHQMKMPKTR